MNKEIAISKDTFIEYMQHICDYMEFDDKLNSVFRDYRRIFDDEADVMLPSVFLIDVVELLKAATNDEDDWIGYFIFELNCGKSWKPGTVTQDDMDIPLGTTEDLWNVLVSK